MNIGLYERKEAQRILADFREIKDGDCLFAPDTPFGKMLLVFNCPEAKGLTDGEDIIFTPSTSFPTVDEPAKLYLNIEVLGKTNLKVAFGWGSIAFKMLLESDLLVFLPSKKPNNLSLPSDLIRFLMEGHLSIELACFHENLRDVIAPAEFATKLFAPLKANVH